MLINFHVALIKDGITRMVNGLKEWFRARPPSPPRKTLRPFATNAATELPRRGHFFRGAVREKA